MGSSSNVLFSWLFSGEKKGDVMQLCFCNSPHTAAVCLYCLVYSSDLRPLWSCCCCCCIMHAAFFFSLDDSILVLWNGGKQVCGVTLKPVSILVWAPPPQARCAGDLPQTMVIMCHCRGSEPFEEEIRSRASGRPHVHRSLRTWQKAYLWEEASFY